MLTLILVIIFISILILVHEWGHFYAARRLGVKVEEFGFGFPPRVFSRIRHGVRYSLNALPFGGFVKIYGEHGEGEGERSSFAARPAWQRFTILAAGVAMNFALAWVLFTAAAAMGVPQASDDPASPVSILTVLPASPAEEAGLRFGDQIVELRAPQLSIRVTNEEEVREFVSAYRGEEITIVVRRGGETREVAATPRLLHPEDEGPLGIAMGRLETRAVPWYAAPAEGLRALGRTTAAVVLGLGEIARELVVERNTALPVAGPVGIISFADDFRSLGFSFFLQFIGILSVNLAVLNILPIPALDGGRILFLAIEKVKRGRISPRVENAVHAAGFVILVLLMILVTFRDVARIM